MAKENITLEELAQMVARGFENAATKADLEQLAKKADVDAVAKQVESVDLHLSALSSQWADEFEALETRVEAIEDRP